MNRAAQDFITSAPALIGAQRRSGCQPGSDWLLTDDPTLVRWLSTDPVPGGKPAGSGQFHSPYVYAGNNPLVMVDPDGELAFMYFLFGAYANVVLNAQHIQNFWDFLGFAAVGAAGAQLCAIGGGTFVNNLIWGVVAGGITSGLNASIAGEDPWQAARQGADWGGAFATVTSGIESFKNYEEGYGFRTNKGVMNQLRKEGDWKTAREFLYERYNLDKDWIIRNADHPSWKNPAFAGMSGITDFNSDMSVIHGRYFEDLRWSIEGTIWHEQLHRVIGPNSMEDVIHGYEVYGVELDLAGILHLKPWTIRNGMKQYAKLTGIDYTKWWNLLPRRF